LLLNGQLIEVFDDFIGLAAVALVSPDGLNQVGGAPIMEEEDALSDAPERSSSELVRAGAALGNAVSQAFAHVVHEQVGEKIRSLIGKRSTRTGGGSARNHCSCAKRRCMAVHTPNLRKQVASLFAGGCGWSGCGWSEHPHEVGKRFDVGDDRGVRNAARIAGGRGSGCEVKGVVGSGVEDTAGSFIALLREELVGDSHLDVVGLACEHEKGFVLRLPSETGDGSIVGTEIHVSAEVRVGVSVNTQL